MDKEIEAAFARSFQAKLYVCISGWNAPLRASSNPFDGSSKFVGLLAEGWLQVGGEADAQVMTFEFDSQTDDRLHYHISTAHKGRTRKLGISRNGYPGFYEMAEVVDYWKIEPLQHTQDGLVCNLRDHRGHRVGVIGNAPVDAAQPPAGMNILDGETYTFLLKPID
ncbi:hypothetical protein [Pseudomonas putida]